MTEQINKGRAFRVGRSLVDASNYFMRKRLEETKFDPQLPGSDDNTIPVEGDHIVSGAQACNRRSSNVFRWKFADGRNKVHVSSVYYRANESSASDLPTLKATLPPTVYTVQLGKWNMTSIKNQSTGGSDMTSLGMQPRGQTINSMRVRPYPGHASKRACLSAPAVPWNAETMVANECKTDAELISYAPHAVGCTCMDWAYRGFAIKHIRQQTHAAKGCKHMIFVDGQIRKTKFGRKLKMDNARHRDYELWESWVNSDVQYGYSKDVLS